MTQPYINEEFNVTIDIAPRQSWKTQRLIHAVVDYAAREEDNRVIIITCNNDQKRAIRNRINSYLGDVGRSLRNKISIYGYNSLGGFAGTGLSHLRNNNMPTKIFFDEFEFMEDVPFVSNSYYTSTPNNDFLLSNTYKILHTMFNGDDQTRMSDEGAHSLYRQYVRIRINERTENEVVTEPVPEMTETDEYLDRLGIDETRPLERPEDSFVFLSHLREENIGRSWDVDFRAMTNHLLLMYNRGEIVTFQVNEGIQTPEISIRCHVFNISTEPQRVKHMTFQVNGDQVKLTATYIDQNIVRVILTDYKRGFENYTIEDM